MKGVQKMGDALVAFDGPSFGLPVSTVWRFGISSAESLQRAGSQGSHSRHSRSRFCDPYEGDAQMIIPDMNPEKTCSAALAPLTLEKWLNGLCPLIRHAGGIVMSIYATDFVVEGKEDASPVTVADRLAEACIVEGLERLTPDVPVVAEEAVAAGSIPDVGSVFWLVDPLDGTREFVSRNGEFTVNIALVVDGVPVLGAVLVPARGLLYTGGPGLGAWVDDGGTKRPIRVRSAPPSGLTVVASRSHGDAAALESFLAGHTVSEVVAAGSSLKLCLVAEGRADVYPRLGRTMEWDIAAGQAVVTGAGGKVLILSGEPLAYGKPGFVNPHFAAWGDRMPQGCTA